MTLRKQHYVMHTGFTIFFLCSHFISENLTVNRWIYLISFLIIFIVLWRVRVIIAFRNAFHWLVFHSQDLSGLLKIDWTPRYLRNTTDWKVTLSTNGFTNIMWSLTTLTRLFVVPLLGRRTSIGGVFVCVCVRVFETPWTNVSWRMGSEVNDIIASLIHLAIDRSDF